MSQQNQVASRPSPTSASRTFPPSAIFRIHHFPAKEAIMNIVYFRSANSFLEPIGNGNYVSSVQIGWGTWGPKAADALIAAEGAP